MPTHDQLTEQRDLVEGIGDAVARERAKAIVGELLLHAKISQLLADPNEDKARLAFSILDASGARAHELESLLTKQLAVQLVGQLCRSELSVAFIARLESFMDAAPQFFAEELKSALFGGGLESKLAGVDDFDASAITTLSDFAASVFGKYHGWLDLGGVTALSASAATALSNGHHRYLSLRGLVVLPGDLAKALARHTGAIDLSGVRTLSVEAAKHLSFSQGELYLDGIVELSDATAHALAKKSGVVTLDSLALLSDSPGHMALARKLATDGTNGYDSYDEGLALNGMSSISPSIMRVLATHKGLLALNGLTELSASLAGELEHHDYLLLLNGLQELSDAAAAALAGHTGPLELNGLKELSGAAASALAGHQGGLGLNGITDLSVTSAKALAMHKGNLLLGGLKAVSCEVADALAAHDGLLGLSGLTSLPCTPSHLKLARKIAEHGTSAFGEEPAVCLDQ